MPVNIYSVQAKLKYFIDQNEYAGYDPYDTLMGWTDFRFLGKWAPVVAVQAHKRNPINLRPLLGIPKQRNAKAMGLLLSAHCQLQGNDVERQRDHFFKWICENHHTTGGWGYPFHWANPEKYLAAGTPSAVVTGFVIQGIHSYYLLTGDARALALMEGAAKFILNDLPRTETPDGICFSYTPVKRDGCYNASLLAAEVLGRLYSVNGDRKLHDLAKNAVDFVIAHQQADGRWNYSLDFASGRERQQIDFHQGFVLDSLHTLTELLDLREPIYHEALARGARFYRQHQFFADGRSKWRLPKIWPVDIHNQAQGIITFSRLAHLDPAYLPFARTIAEWTIKNMQDKKGYFYYQKHRFYTNRIPYMRWSQAWMMLALATLMFAIKKNR